MSYLVLARKYRPQTFEEIVGQEHVTRTLASAISSGRVHHAFLFCGARGVGKTTAARILAKCLSCDKAPTAVPCNVCDSCNEITGGASVDVQEIDGASNNSVDDVRTLREGVRYLPVRGKKKVYIIDEVHMLSTGAFNALLKTLEEPPPHAVFIFATTEVHKIPITILSRVQRYDFRLVSSQRIAQHLAKVLTEEGIAFSPGALQVVAREAGGSVRDSLSLLEQVLATSVSVDAAGDHGTAVASEQAAADALGVADRGLVSDLGRAVLARDTAGALGLIAAAVERNVDLKHLGEVFLEHLRNLLVARVVANPAPLIEASEVELAELQKSAKQAAEGLLPLLFDRASRVVEDVSRSPLPRFTMEVGLVELCSVEPLEPIGELIDRLESLESRLAPGGGPSGGGPSGGGGYPRPASSSIAARPPAPAPLRAEAPAQPPPAWTGPRPTDWNSLSKALTDRRPLFASLMTGQQVRFDEREIEVAFVSAFELGQAKEKLLDVQAMAREILGVPVTITFREGRGVIESAHEVELKVTMGEREIRRREALEHPSRRLIRNAFGDDVTFKEPEVE